MAEIVVSLMLSNDVVKTLETTASLFNNEGHEWVVFGGAAMALHGYDVGNINDIDIVVSAETAAWLMGQLSLENQADTRSPRFQSDYVLRPNLGPTPVEVLANFRIRAGGMWHWVRPTKLASICVRQQTVFVPEVKELAEIFDLCGRAKDAVKSQMLMAGLSAK
ncbi:MAG: hypothetical protein JKX69_10970 [Rhodobacteraceae bacterium]|nr:hypothetical protein [Paracoccaceae bacterium]